MLKPALITMITAGFLSFCDTAEERAEAHFQSGRELMEQGDVDRALVEFRNVFKLNGTHREARLMYADAERARGNIREAAGQYLRLVEQYPDSLEGQRALAELSVQIGDLEGARRHGALAAALDPNDIVVKSINLAVQYDDARKSGDAAGIAEVVRQVSDVVEADPSQNIARRVLIDEHIRNQNWTAALAAIDTVLASEPDARILYSMRLGVLEQLGETREIAAQLESMVDQFPDDPSVPLMLVRWYVSQDDIDAAEAFLKQRALAPEAEVESILALIQFISQFRGNEAAEKQLEEILAGSPPGVERLKALQAGFRFDAGLRDESISEMEALIDGMEPSDERRRIQVMLSRMLDRTDNNVGARALVETVLAEDPLQTDALKLRAGWLIEDDRTDEAIVALRSALGEAPNDAEAMTLLARAHERAGNTDLMAEMLSRAVEASGNAPEESLRYARFLLSRDDRRTAETVVINALRTASGNANLLAALGDIYVRDQDWSRLEQVIASLKQQENTPQALLMADELTARSLAAQNRQDELMTFLDGLAGQPDGDVAVSASMIRVRLAQGDLEGAQKLVDEVVAANPESRAIRFLQASFQSVTGQAEAAAVILRDLKAEDPTDERVWLSLFSVLQLQEDRDGAKAVLDEALEVLPDSLRLNWIRASMLEQSGDVEGAIAVYEKMYDIDSNNLIIANNLASLLSTARTDDENLTRAYEIARRLRDRDVPAFQDTYGWIAFRRGDLDSALSSLEPAAAGLPGDPRVQYHLAKVYVALGRDEDALAQFQKVVEAVGDTARPDFMDEVEAELARLSAGGTTQEGAKN